MTTNINMGSFEETKGPSSLGTDVWEQYEGAEAKFRWEKDENADSCQELDCEGVFSNLQSGCEFIPSPQPALRASIDKGEEFAF